MKLLGGVMEFLSLKLTRVTPTVRHLKVNLLWFPKSVIFSPDLPIPAKILFFPNFYRYVDVHLSFCIVSSIITWNHWRLCKTEYLARSEKLSPWQATWYCVTLNASTGKHNFENTFFLWCEKALLLVMAKAWLILHNILFCITFREFPL